MKNTQRHVVDGLDRWAVAHEMALSGYSKAATALHTGFHPEECRCIFGRLKRQGYLLGQQGRLRGSLMIVRNRERKIQISLLMLIYCTLGGQRVYESIQLSDLGKAFLQYRKMQKTYSMHHWDDLDINDAWSLARELRDGEAFIKTCRSCDLPNFTSLHQYTSVDCPFCLPYTE